jgi:hypothetical protein
LAPGRAAATVCEAAADAEVALGPAAAATGFALGLSAPPLP